MESAETNKRIWVPADTAGDMRMPASPPTAEPNPHALFGAACLAAAAFLFGLVLITNLLPAKVGVLTANFFLADEPWLLAIGVFSAMMAQSLRTKAASKLSCLTRRMALMRRVGWTSALLAAFLFATSSIGTLVVMHRYSLSRDEAMVDFDTSIIARGRLLADVPETWRPYVNALQPLFILSVKENVGWTSSYLPMNAALRSGFAVVASPLIAGPCLAVIALLALIGIAHQLWPDRPDAAVVAGIMLAFSPQVAVNAMTSYAMTAHLALNLIWLFLFLRGSKTSILSAVFVGFCATGLHQLAFHPLFATPFIAMLWVRGRYARAAVYTIAYAAILLFWISYWHVMFGVYSLDGKSSASSISFVGRALGLAHAPNLDTVEVMLMNVARFTAWQNPLLLPLVFATLSRWRRWTDTVVALLLGIAATLVVVSAVSVYQGYGWGYRYLHGSIGSFALLAAFAYVELTRVSRAETIRLFAPMAMAAIFAALVALPLRAVEARALTLPYAAAAHRIETAHSDLVFIDPDGMMNASDLVRNQPDLSNHPLVFDLTKLAQSQIRTLCSTYDIAVFDAADGRELGLPSGEPDQPNPSPSRRSFMRSLKCGHPVERR